LAGRDGLLKRLNTTVLNAALTQESTEYLGYAKNRRPDPLTGNVHSAFAIIFGDRFPPA
jgi:hypothetical protein